MGASFSGLTASVELAHAARFSLCPMVGMLRLSGDSLPCDGGLGALGGYSGWSGRRRGPETVIRGLREKVRVDWKVRRLGRVFNLRGRRVSGARD
jgi:hypothetical protein